VPAYDYRCDRCDRTFEVRQRISEAPLTTCDRCGGPIRRLLSAAPFILKGGGWYVTDYPSEGRKKGLEADKKSNTESAGTTSGSDGAASTTSPAKSGSDGAASTTSPAKSGAASSDASTASSSKSTSTSSS
jgi:putative FmdB family regulatory protein